MLIWTELRARKGDGLSVSDSGREGSAHRGQGVRRRRRAASRPDAPRLAAKAPSPNKSAFEFSDAQPAPLLGARMVLGRHFTEDDGKPQPRNPPSPPGAPPAAQQAQPPQLPAMAISRIPFWQRKFGGDSTRRRPDDRLRQRQSGDRRRAGAGLRAAVSAADRHRSERRHVDRCARLDFDAAARNTGALRVVARMKDGVTLEQARAEAEALRRRCANGIR